METNNEVKNKSGLGSLIGLIIVIGILVVVLMAVMNLWNNKGAKHESCFEESELYVKNEVYKNYGEIPTMESENLYSVKDSGHFNEIIVVRWKCENGFDGSYAVNVHHYTKKGTSTVISMTSKEEAYDMDYTSSLEELKTIFMIK